MKTHSIIDQVRSIPLDSEVRLRSAPGSSREGETVRGRALLRLYPRPKLEFRSSEENLASWGDAVLISPSTTEDECFTTSKRTTLGENGPRTEVTWSPKRQPVLIRRLDEPAREICFHVLNFPRFNGQGDEVRTSAEGGLSRHGRVRVQVGSWAVDLQESTNPRQVEDYLDASRGFGLTHRGRLVRSDGGPIDTDEACLLLDALDDFLSFARGRCCSLGLVEARSETGRVSWERWGCRRVDPWGRSTSWFDSLNGQSLGQVLPGFWRVWTASSDERAALHQAIYWSTQRHEPEHRWWADLDAGRAREARTHLLSPEETEAERACGELVRERFGEVGEALQGFVWNVSESG